MSADGVLIVDKPSGPTSHDVVAQVRRALGTRSVGHAGTLDPLATGVLVIAVGEATKLVRWLTADDKAYRAVIALGAETDTLDADGQVTERVPPSEPITLARARAAAVRFVGTIRQVPPAYSAIKIAGEALHVRARRGEHVEVPEREVRVSRIDVREADDARIELEVEAQKGFYVRSLARDLARALGTRGHLSALRRTRSGPFTLEGALDGELVARAARGDEEARAHMRSQLRTLGEACIGMPRIALVDRGVSDAHHGRAIDLRFAPGAQVLPDGTEPIALLDANGALLAIGARLGEELKVRRGIRPR